MCLGLWMVYPARLELDEEIGELVGAQVLVNRDRVVRSEQLDDHRAGELRECPYLRDVRIDDHVAGIEAVAAVRLGQVRIHVDVGHEQPPLESDDVAEFRRTLLWGRAGPERAAAALR